MKIDATLEFYNTIPEIDDKTILAVVETNTGIEMFVAVIDEYGDLKFPDTGDDIGWSADSVSYWADLDIVYEKIGNKETPEICSLRIKRDVLWDTWKKLPVKDSFSGLAVSDKLNEVQEKLDKLGDESERYYTKINMEV